MNLDIHEVKSLMTRAESMDFKGKVVPELEANITKAGLYIDADTKEPFLAYLPLDAELVTSLRKAVRNVKYAKEGVTRQNTGTGNQSRTFGMAPRKPFQTRESCRPTALSYEQPEEHATLVDIADALAKIMRDIAPDIYNEDVAETAGVEKEWRISDDSLWTSGVINKTATLPYHTDGNNFDMWSAMPVVRRGVRGGYLHMPEYDATIECRDGWAAFFPGFRFVHGVTPILKTSKDSYRYSVVYYCLRGMKDCFTYAVEAAEGAKRRTKREVGLASAVKGDIPFKVQGKKK